MAREPFRRARPAAGQGANPDQFEPYTAAAEADPGAQPAISEGVQSADQLETWQGPPSGEPPQPAPPPPAEDFAGPGGTLASNPAWSPLDWLLLAILTIGGGIIRFVRLSFPKAYVFDEIYYAKDACLYLAHGMHFCKSPGVTEQSYVHPELGKWIIAVGEAIWGYNSFGWRIMACLFGTAMIVIVFLIGRKLFGRWGGVLAGLFTATDFLLIVESRTSMLDIFLAFFVALGFLFVICDHQRVLRMRAAGEGKLDLRWRIAAGIAFGCAASVKWSGFYALAGAGILLVVWNVGTTWKLRIDAHEAGLPPRSPPPVRELNMTILAVGIPVAAIYLLQYGVWFADNRWSLPAWWHLQQTMYSFNVHLKATHPYSSRPWTWPLIKIPVAYWFASSNACKVAANVNQPSCRYAYILAFGNPATWWPAIAAVGYMAFRAIKRKHGPERFLLVAVLFQYLPWFEAARTSFFYYMTPIVPFTMLALTGALRDIVRATKLRFVTGMVCVYVAIACGGLLWFWFPDLIGIGIPQTWWHQRMLWQAWICGHC